MTNPQSIGDLTTAARLLMNVSTEERGPLAARLVEMANAANAHRVETGKAHPRWGNGSLMALCMNMSEELTGKPLAPEGKPTDMLFNFCMQHMLVALQPASAVEAMGAAE